MIFLWFPTPASKLAKKPWPRFSTSSWRNWKMTCGSAVRPGRLGQASEEHLPIAKSEGIVWYYGWPIIALLTLHLHELVETTRNHQNIWVNYNDFTVLPNPGIMVNKGNHPQMAASFRLVKYYNSPRWIDNPQLQTNQLGLAPWSSGTFFVTVQYKLAPICPPTVDGNRFWTNIFLIPIEHGHGNSWFTH